LPVFNNPEKNNLIKDKPLLQVYLAQKEEDKEK